MAVAPYLISGSPLAKGLLSGMANVDAAAVRALDKVSIMFDNESSSGRPN